MTPAGYLVRERAVSIVPVRHFFLDLFTEWRHEQKFQYVREVFCLVDYRGWSLNPRTRIR